MDLYIEEVVIERLRYRWRVEGIERQSECPVQINVVGRGQPLYCCHLTFTFYLIWAIMDDIITLVVGSFRVEFCYPKHCQTGAMLSLLTDFHLFSVSLSFGGWVPALSP